MLVALRLAVRDFFFCLCYKTFGLLAIRWLLDVGGGPPAPATLRGGVVRTLGGLAFGCGLAESQDSLGGHQLDGPKLIQALLGWHAAPEAPRDHVEQALRLVNRHEPVRAIARLDRPVLSSTARTVPAALRL